MHSDFKNTCNNLTNCDLSTCKPYNIHYYYSNNTCTTILHNSHRTSSIKNPVEVPPSLDTVIE